MHLLIWLCVACLAAFIAHRKGRSAIGCFFLSLLSPPLGLIAALLVSPKSETGIRNPRAAKLLLGLLPLWAAITVVSVGSFTSRSSDYWYVAPWLILASIPVCLVLLVLIEVFSAMLSNGR